MATTTAVPLHLSSPPMEGGDVAQAQRLLLHNPFGTFDPGPIDGVYGERTAAAVRRAKYWLGYPEKQIDEIASPDMVAMLAGGVAQPPGFKATHTRRLRRAQDVGLWNTAYDIAISNVGERETPAGSRRIDCTDWYGVPAPWSAIFVSWCYARAGSTAFSAGARYAYVPHILWDAQRGENQLSITRRPLPGDLPVFDLDGDGVADHVGMFDDWTGQPGTTFCTIEGNVTSSGEPNGGRIAQLERRADQRVMAFVHVRG